MVDDHAVVRTGLRGILADSQLDAEVFEAPDGGEALAMVRAEEWDLVLLDISMPGPSGFSVLASIRRERPRLPVLMLSVHDEEPYALRALRAGANGYLTKETAPDELVRAIGVAASGGTYIGPGLGEALRGRWPDQGDHPPPHESLTDREFEIASLLASGVPVMEIAARLGINYRTVSTHRKHLLEKLALKNNAQLARYALDQGLID